MVALAADPAAVGADAHRRLAMHIERPRCAFLMRAPMHIDRGQGAL
jgi:hypothetical protein